MQVNSINSVACQFIKSIAFLAIDKEGLRERLVHRVPRHFIQGISQMEKEWLPYLYQLQPCPVLHGVENDKSTPIDDVTAVSAAVQVIDVDSPDGATKGAAGPDVIDVDAPAATLNACPSGAIGSIANCPRLLMFQ